MRRPSELYGNRDQPGEQWVCISEYEAPKNIEARDSQAQNPELRTVTEEVFAIGAVPPFSINHGLASAATANTRNLPMNPAFTW